MNIQGIIVDEEEIKLGLFADDLRTVPTNSEVFLRSLSLLSKEILARAIEIRKENWG